MADFRDAVDWKDKSNIWASIPSAKSAVTRACTAIDKLTEREYTFANPAASDEARKRLLEAFDFCVKLHDRWSDLDLLDGNELASETAAKSIKPYEEKQFAALAQLDKYIAENATPPATTAADQGQAASIPKLATCKLLFPEKLTKSKTPCQFRLWIAAFQRFHDVSGLKLQSVATQQGYLLQAIDTDLQDIVARQMTSKMPIFEWSKRMIKVQRTILIKESNAQVVEAGTYNVIVGYSRKEWSATTAEELDIYPEYASPDRENLDLHEGTGRSEPLPMRNLCLKIHG